MNICVYAASSDTLDPTYYNAARTLGRLLARGGHRLVYGGGAGGLMGACARGVLEKGGEIYGVAPRFFDEPGVLLRENCTLFLTETMAQRKEHMAAKADAFIALPGGIGTYEEFFETLTLKQLGRHNKPIALLNTLGYYAPFHAMMQMTAEKGFMSRSVLTLYTLCDTPEQALSAVTAPVAAASAERGIANYGK